MTCGETAVHIVTEWSGFAIVISILRSGSKIIRASRRGRNRAPQYGSSPAHKQTLPGVRLVELRARAARNLPDISGSRRRLSAPSIRDNKPRSAPETSRVRRLFLFLSFAARSERQRPPPMMKYRNAVKRLYIRRSSPHPAAPPIQQSHLSRIECPSIKKRSFSDGP